MYLAVCYPVISREGYLLLILVTRFDGSTLYINPELIRSVEHTPDTVITLSNEYKIVIRETAEEIRQRFIDYQRQIRGDAFLSFLNSMKKEE